MIKSVSLSRIPITGVGLVSPAGTDCVSSWEFILSGQCSAEKHPALKDLEVDYACSVPNFNPANLLGRSLSRGIDRFIQFALVACREAIRNAGLNSETWDGSRVGIVVGNSLSGIKRFIDQQHVIEKEGARMVSPSTIPGAMINMVAGQIAIDCNVTGPSLAVSTACASGITAIDVGYNWIMQGLCDIVIVGASEAPLTPLVVAGMNRLGALSKNPNYKQASKPFDAERGGFVIAEGCGIIVLESKAHMRSRSKKPLAYVSGIGSSTDAYHITTPHPDGLGLKAAIKQALSSAGLEGRNIQYVNAHGTSTRLNDIIESNVITELIGEHTSVTSLKGAIGHTLAASGAVELVLTILSVKNGIIPPTVNLTKQDPEIHLDIVKDKPRLSHITHALKLSLGFGGHNAAIIISSC